MDYIVTGCSLLNDLVYADKTRIERVLGGAIYALGGIRPYTDSVAMATTAGPDFEQLFGAYYTANGLSREGVKDVLLKTQYNVVEYELDGRWREYSKYGDDYKAYTALSSLIRAPYLKGLADETTKGIYFESDVDEFIWNELDTVRALAPNAKLMWELPPWDIEVPEKRGDIIRLIGDVDIFSLNLPEGMQLFGADSEQAVIEAIMKTEKPCFFRLGERGSCMIQNGKAWYAPAVDVDKSVDPTGCGNCSTGAALFGWCEGFHPLKTAILANLAAGLNARQYGPFPKFTRELRAQLEAQANEMFDRLTEER